MAPHMREDRGYQLVICDERPLTAAASGQSSPYKQAED